MFPARAVSEQESRVFTAFRARCRASCSIQVDETPAQLQELISTKHALPLSTKHLHCVSSPAPRIVQYPSKSHASSWRSELGAALRAVSEQEPCVLALQGEIASAVSRSMRRRHSCKLISSKHALLLSIKHLHCVSSSMPRIVQYPSTTMMATTIMCIHMHPYKSFSALYMLAPVVK